MGILAAISIDEIRQRGSIRDSDVARLRAAYEVAVELSPAEADALFALHAAAPIQDPTWSEFLVEVITEYVVNLAPPTGYVVAENARWLRQQVSTFGRVETSTELSLLVHVLETARWTPPSLAAFALDQIRHGIETGTGPLRAGRNLAPGAIAPEEVDLAARIVRAFGGETSIAVTRAEADALIGINRAIGAGRSSPAWSMLLVRTVGAAVLAAMGHAVPARRELVDAAPSDNVAPDIVEVFFRDAGQTASAHPSLARRQANGFDVWRTARILSPEERALSRLERQRLEIVTNEVIEEPADEWLITRLTESLPADANEAALLAYVVREASRCTPALTTFAARCRIAA